MNVKEKLEVFSKIALKEAEEKNLELLNEMNSEYNAACDEIRLREHKKSEQLLDEAVAKAEQIKNKTVLEASKAAKRSLYDLRNSLIDSLFSNTVNRIADYIETDEYANTLYEEIKNNALKYNTKMIIHLCERDNVFAERLKSIPNVKIVTDLQESIGGYKAELPELGILIDNSFSERIKEERLNFVGFKIT